MQRTALPLTQENLIVEWRTLAQTLFQNDANIRARLEQNLPTLQPDGTTVEVVADNPMVEEHLKQHSFTLLQHLKETFGQQAMKLHTRVREQEARPMQLTRQQQYLKMCEENEALKRLSDEFHLELASV